MNALVQQETRALAAGGSDGRMAVAEILSHVTRVQEVMRAVMKPDVHYGVIPGTDKPTLLKPGAELLCMTFRIGATYLVEDLSTEHVVRYRATCTGTHQTTGLTLGTGMGEASSGEEKYKWVKAYQEEWDATPENLRRKKSGWNKQKRERYETLQVRTDPANLANTILKMANKRAYLAMVLSVTAASDCFSQDLEDMEERLREHLADHGGVAAAEPEAAAGKKPYPADEFTKNLSIWTKAASKGKTPQEIIDTVYQRNPEFEFTEEQLARIKSLGAKPAADVTDAAPKVTFAQVADRIVKAESGDQLDEAESLIAAVQAEEQRKDLTAKAAARRAELTQEA